MTDAGSADAVFEELCYMMTIRASDVTGLALASWHAKADRKHAIDSQELESSFR